jgi:hypothetical protein
VTPQERFEHDWCVAEIRKLKALLLAPNTTNTSKVIASKADFIVDLFDRADVDSLGVNWSVNPISFQPFVIRGKRAVPASLNVAYDPLSHFYNLGHSFYSESVAFVLTILQDRQFYATTNYTTTTSSSAIVRRDVVYHAHGLSSPDMTVEIIFDGPPVPREEAQAAPVGAPAGFDGRNIYTDLISAGVVLSKDAFAGTDMVAVIRGLSLPAVTFPLGATPALCPADFVVSDSIRSFNLATQKFYDPNVPEFGATTVGFAGTGSNAFTNMNRYLPSALLPVVDNKLRLQATGESYMITLNGKIMYAGSNTLTVDRSAVGLASMGVNMLAMINAVGMAPIGIRSFKAWRSDHPEPPNESGYGTWKGGLRTYQDGYHIPVLDAQGKRVGYTYNPDL